MSVSKAKKAKQAAVVNDGTSSRRFYTWVIVFLALAQLLVGLDYITLWPGAETAQVWQSVQADAAKSMSSLLLSVLPEASSYWLLLFRIGSSLLYVFAVLLFYRWAKPLFGKESVDLSLLVLCGSLLLPTMAKMASLDMWSFAFELGAWLSLLHFMKDVQKKWLIRIAVFGSVAVLFGQAQTLVLLLIWQVMYYRLASTQNESAKQHIAKPFVIIYIVFAIVSVLFGLNNNDSYYFNVFGLGFHRFLLFSVLGLAPFLGFTMAAFRDLFFKVKKGEELAKLIAVGLLGSFLAQSLVFPFLLIFLTAKQIQLSFKIANYPWNNWVRTFQILHLVVVFVGVIVALLGGFANFETDGFRAVLGCSAAYWMFSFLAVVGIFADRRDYVVGGMVLAGVVSLLFFWIQVYPFLHLKRNWPERMLTKIEKVEPAIQTVSLDEQSLQLAPYLERKGIRTQLHTDTTAAQLVVSKAAAIDSTQSTAIQIEAWSGLWQSGVWVAK